MKIARLLRIGALALSAALPRAVAAQEAAAEPARLTVIVLDDGTGAPVRNARVELPGVSRAVFTNGNGVARVDRAPAGNRIVTVTRLGYAAGRVAVDLPAGGDVEQTVRLGSDAVSVDGVTAQGERRDPVLDDRGFYRRQQTGFGAHMTGDQIDHIRPSRTIDLFRRVRGFQVTYDRRGNPFLMTSRGGAGLGSYCTSVMVFLDGMPVTSRAVPPAAALEMIPPEQIAGIEAFAGPSTIPAEYNPTGTACGVVLIWSRTR